MEIRDKKILVFGLAESGVGASNLLASLGAKVTVTDSKPKEALMKYVERLLPPVRLSLGGHPDGILQGVDMIVLSPGVPPGIQPLKKAKEMGIRIIGELELAYQVIQDTGYRIQDKKKDISCIVHHASSPPSFLAITGTNGKSTTTTLLNEMLNRGGFRTILGGNIGNALTEEIGKLIQDAGYKIQDAGYKIQDDINHASCIMHHASIDFVVAEVSSFQLESIEMFRPAGASILNITPDHMDRYHSMEKYKDAKEQIFANQQKEDFLVLNADDHEVMRLYDSRFKIQDSRLPGVYFFSRKKEVNGIYFKDGIVFANFTNSSLLTSNSKLIKADEINIKGVHNLENAMAASAMALLAGCPADAVISALKDFEGLEHRLELVREFEGVDYINDSKGTNVDAVVKSLESFSMPVILIAGGRDKDGDFSLLSSLVKSRVKKLVLIGEAREKIKEFLGGLTETIFADNLKEAVMISRKSASKGDVVLLSPACASFDMFRDYKDRGEQFKKIVKGLS